MLEFLKNNGVSTFSIRSSDMVGVESGATSRTPIEWENFQEQSRAHPVASLGGLFDRGAADKPRLSIEDDIQVAQIRVAFARLPTVYQEILILQVRWGRSTIDIASKLNLTLPQTLTRLFLARRQLHVLCGEDTQMEPAV